MCSISHPLHIRCAPVPCLLHSPHLFRGLAAQRVCSFRALRSSLTTALQSQTRQSGIPIGMFVPGSLFGAAVSSFVDADTVRIPVVPPCSVQSLLCSAVFRGVIEAFRQTAPASLTASSLRCLTRSRLLRHHFGTHLAPAAGLSRFKLSGILLLLDCKCKRRSDRCTPLKPHPVRRLPRRTGLPARDFCPSGFTADAVKPPCQKPPSPPILTHASAYCQERPASPARTGLLEIQIQKQGRHHRRCQCQGDSVALCQRNPFPCLDILLACFMVPPRYLFVQDFHGPSPSMGTTL